MCYGPIKYGSRIPGPQHKRSTTKDVIQNNVFIITQTTPKLTIT